MTLKLLSYSFPGLVDWPIYILPIITKTNIYYWIQWSQYYKINRETLKMLSLYYS